MRLFHPLVSIICGVTLVVCSDTTKLQRKIYPQRLIFPTSRNDEIHACSVDLCHCDKWDLYGADTLFHSSASDNTTFILASYNNLIYSFLGSRHNLLIFDIYGNKSTIFPGLQRVTGLDSLHSRPIAVHKGFIYTVIDSELYECSVNVLEGCQVIIDDAKFRNLRTIKFHKEYIYMGYAGRIERCSKFYECYESSVLETTGADGTAMAFAGEYFYVNSAQKAHVLRCKTDTMECNGLNITAMVGQNTSISALYTFSKSIYFVGSNTSWKCNLTDINSCERLELDNDNFIISYSTVEMLPVYREEDERCSWQPADKCRNYVTYVKDATRLELSVSRNGKLIGANGELFDTSNASYMRFDTTNASRRIRAAIFVMDNGGSIYASNYHEPYKYYHSSLMAGKPVSSAGYLQVSKGVIKFVSSCSEHYKVPVEIAEQFLDSLYLQGYNASVVDMAHNCTYEAFTHDYNASFGITVYDRGCVTSTNGRSSGASYFGAVRMIYVCCILVIFHSIQKL